MRCWYHHTTDATHLAVYARLPVCAVCAESLRAEGRVCVSLTSEAGQAWLSQKGQSRSVHDTSRVVRVLK